MLELTVKQMTIKQIDIFTQKIYQVILKNMNISDYAHLTLAPYLVIAGYEKYGQRYKWNGPTP